MIEKPNHTSCGNNQEVPKVIVTFFKNIVADKEVAVVTVDGQRLPSKKKQAITSQFGNKVMLVMVLSCNGTVDRKLETKVSVKKFELWIKFISRKCGIWDNLTKD